MKENYLETHLEPPISESEKPKSKEELADMYPESVLRLFNPDVKYGGSGHESVELKDGWTLEYAYEEIGDSDVALYSKVYEKVGTLGQDIENGKYRRLTNLSIKDNRGKDLDIFDKFDVKDVFFSVDSGESVGSHSDSDNGRIFLNCPPNSFISIMTLLHEIGHIVNFRSDTANHDEKVLKTMKDRTILKMPLIFHSFLPTKVVETVGEDILRSERDAWAVTIAMLRKTIDAFDVPKDDLIDAVHKTGLTLYSDRIREIQKGITFEDAKKFVSDIFTSGRL